MAYTSDEFDKVIATADAAASREDLTTSIDQLDRMLKDGFFQEEGAILPFMPALGLTKEFEEAYFSEQGGGAEGAFAGAIGGIAVDAANRLSRAKRRAEYRLKTLFGFDGLRIVEEGDSWTQYPILLEDIGDQLQAKDDLAVFSVGAAGDLVSNMALEKEYLDALEKTSAPALLLSGGGNDMFQHLEGILLDYEDDANPADLIDNNKFDPILKLVIDSYQTILSDVAANFPSVKVFTHGYDLPFPLENGKWMGPALDAHNIPLAIGRATINVILQRFNTELSGLSANNSNMVFCDLRGKVDRGLNSWFDELHPKNAGYARAAVEIEKTIRNTLVSGTNAEDGAGAELRNGGGAENNAASETIVLDPGHGGTTTIGGSSPNNATGPRGTLEKALTLEVALRTKTVLESRGYSVVLTRSTDVNLGLSDRAAVARAIGAAAFVSIHFNASSNHNAQGTETFVHRSLPDGAHISKALCRAVQAEMVAALGHRDRNLGHELGAKRGGFGVINPTRHAAHTAAVLHEVSFLDRSDEENRLATVSYKRKIAVALADGIETYLSGIVPAESLQTAGAEIGDAVELALNEGQLVADANRLFDWQPGLESNFAGQYGADDVSNGHLIGGGEIRPVSKGFVDKLAEIEVRFSKGDWQTIKADDEGVEPSEFDPAVEHAFSATSSNSETTISRLTNLFGGAESTGFDLADFEAFIQSLGLRHFSASEFLVQGGQNASGRCAGRNTLPPRALWPNIANTARMIDAIRERLNAPVFITSAYRSPTYNSCIGGATASQHMRFNALDWYCTSHTRSRWRQVAESVRASNLARFDGFIDDYPSGNFVHIDTRRS